jgi:hypothetical protein
MPVVLAAAASDLILYSIVAAVAALAIWLVGHTVEKDVHAVGDELGELADKLGKNTSKILNPGVLIAVLAVAFLVTRRHK